MTLLIEGNLPKRQWLENEVFPEPNVLGFGPCV